MWKKLELAINRYNKNPSQRMLHYEGWFVGQGLNQNLFQVGRGLVHHTTYIYFFLSLCLFSSSPTQIKNKKKCGLTTPIYQSTARKLSAQPHITPLMSLKLELGMLEAGR